MLTDFFAHRYATVELCGHLDESKRIFLGQASRLILDQLVPDDYGEKFKSRDALAHSVMTQVFMELGQRDPHIFTFDPAQVLQDFLLQQPRALEDEELFLKNRLSVVELAFRRRELQIEQLNLAFPHEVDKASAAERGLAKKSKQYFALGMTFNYVRDLKLKNGAVNNSFHENVRELNARMARAGLELTYHAGFLQRSGDQLIEDRVRQPFWNAIDNAIWVNVETDMLEALDTNDKGGRDPSLYAAKALESTVKIISDTRGWSSGSERGAATFLENLKKNGYMDQWEEDILKSFFSKVRNPVGHGPGMAPMPSFSAAQNEWVINFCMSWIRSLVLRF